MAQGMMGGQMVRRRRRRGLLRDGVTTEPCGKRGRDGEGLDHGACLPPSLRNSLCHIRVEGPEPPIRVQVRAVSLSLIEQHRSRLFQVGLEALKVVMSLGK